MSPDMAVGGFIAIGSCYTSIQSRSSNKKEPLVAAVTSYPKAAKPKAPKDLDALNRKALQPCSPTILNDYLCYFGFPYYKHSVIDTKTRF